MVSLLDRTQIQSSFLFLPAPAHPNRGKIARSLWPPPALPRLSDQLPTTGSVLVTTSGLPFLLSSIFFPSSSSRFFLSLRQQHGWPPSDDRISSDASSVPMGAAARDPRSGPDEPVGTPLGPNQVRESVHLPCQGRAIRWPSPSLFPPPSGGSLPAIEAAGSGEVREAAGLPLARLGRASFPLFPSLSLSLPPARGWTHRMALQR